MSDRQPTDTDLTTEDIRAKMAKLNQELVNATLAANKLELEIASLRRANSRYGQALEWLKAASAPVAIIGFVVTFLIGLSQVHQTEENRAADRFEKALSRLASRDRTERLTGISALRLVLSERNQTHHGPALHFLVAALAEEKEEDVRSALSEIMKSLSGMNLDGATLNEALKVAVERNRSLYRALRAKETSEYEVLRRQIVADFLSTKPEDIPDEQLNKYSDPLNLFRSAEINLDQLKILLPKRTEFIQRANPSSGLAGLREAIQILVEAGGKTADYRGIYCPGCDFRAAGSLKNSNLSGAYLREAIFEGMNLSGASFANADIGGARFFAANLIGANLTVADYTAHLHPLSNGNGARYPLLDCADLRGADLSGQILVTLDQRSIRPAYIRAAFLPSARVDGDTKLRSFGVIASRLFGESTQLSGSTDDARALVKSKFADFASPSIPVLGFREPSYSNEAGNELSIGTLEIHRVSAIPPGAANPIAGYIVQKFFEKNALRTVGVLPKVIETASHSTIKHLLGPPWGPQTSHTCAERDLSEGELSISGHAPSSDLK
jgi:uncharacterized protein YjbI with pentapeptide repeats